MFSDLSVSEAHILSTLSWFLSTRIEYLNPHSGKSSKLATSSRLCSDISPCVLSATRGTLSFLNSSLGLPLSNFLSPLPDQVFQLLSQSPAPHLSLCVLAFAPHSCSRPLKNSFALHSSSRPLKSNICPNLDLNPIGSPGGSDSKESAWMWETQVWSLGWEDQMPWRRKWQPTPSILAWRISWTEEPGQLQSMGLQRVRHDWATNTHTHTRSGESHGQRSLDSYSPWGCKESDMTEQLTHTHTYTHVHMCAIYFYVISAPGCILSVRNPRLTARLSCTQVGKMSSRDVKAWTQTLRLRARQKGTYSCSDLGVCVGAGLWGKGVCGAFSVGIQQGWEWNGLEVREEETRKF